MDSSLVLISHPALTVEFVLCNGLPLCRWCTSSKQQVNLVSSLSDTLLSGNAFLKIALVVTLQGLHSNNFRYLPCSNGPGTGVKTPNPIQPVLGVWNEDVRARNSVATSTFAVCLLQPFSLSCHRLANVRFFRPFGELISSSSKLR